jgi:hypothetical protein
MNHQLLSSKKAVIQHIFTLLFHYVTFSLYWIMDIHFVLLSRIRNPKSWYEAELKYRSKVSFYSFTLPLDRDANLLNFSLAEEDLFGIGDVVPLFLVSRLGAFLLLEHSSAES